jgi:hypothetical protein
MGSIKTNTSLLVSSRKIKDLLHVSFWNNLEKNIVIHPSSFLWQNTTVRYGQELHPSRIVDEYFSISFNY